MRNLVRLAVLGLLPCLSQFLSPTPACGADSELGPTPLGAFAFADTSGTLVLAPAGLVHRERLTTALAPGGRRLPIEFVAEQPADRLDSGRQTERNFAHQAGTLFRILRGRVNSGEDCFLTTDSLLDSATTLPVRSPRASRFSTAASWKRFSTLRHRPVVHCWPLARVGERDEVVLLEYERRGKDALASVALAGGGFTTFYDDSAEFEGEGEDLWRVDDGGTLEPEGFQILFALRTPHAILMGLDWGGSEGVDQMLLVSGDRRTFAINAGGYRYLSP